MGAPKHDYWGLFLEHFNANLFQINMSSTVSQMVGVKGFEPLRLAAADFKSAASAVPPHPRM